MRRKVVLEAPDLGLYHLSMQGERFGKNEFPGLYSTLRMHGQTFIGRLVPIP